jgi:hypothetical protein
MNALPAIVIEPAKCSHVTCRVSCLMSTYGGETAEHLTASLESIFAQTVPPDQLVLVIDGTIGPAQEAVIVQYQHDPRVNRIEILRLPTNQGLAKAMNAGLAVCSGDWIMRMDSDDLSEPDRLAIQLRYVEQYTDVDIFSSWSEEFCEEDGRRQIKSSPVEHKAVIESLRWRNIIVHPYACQCVARSRRLSCEVRQVGRLRSLRADGGGRSTLSGHSGRIGALQGQSAADGPPGRLAILGRRGSLSYLWFSKPRTIHVHNLRIRDIPPRGSWFARLDVSLSENHSVISQVARPGFLLVPVSLTLLWAVVMALGDPLGYLMPVGLAAVLVVAVIGYAMLRRMPWALITLLLLQPPASGEGYLAE